MPSIDFLISSPGHHLEAARPVIARLEAAGQRCRLLSLCEFRGLDTPADPLGGLSSEVLRLLPLRPRRPSTLSGLQRPSPGRAALLGWLRAAAWRGVLGPALGRTLRPPPRLAVVPNDTAYPYDRIVDRYRRHDVPIVLLQEGIRFPLPAEGGSDRYGTGAVAAIAAWGESSADHFRRLGVPAHTIHLTGSPRFDGLDPPAWRRQGDELRRRLRLGERTLLLVSNPIDDQGFCTGGEKIRLLTRFASELAPLFADHRFHLAVRPHRREDPRAFDPLRRGAAAPERVTIVRDEPLYPLFAAARAVVVLASTVGLEALMLGRPLAVLELPGWGFVHDYVRSGAARGLSWASPLAPQVAAMLDAGGGTPAVESYLERSLATRNGAADRVARLILELAG